MVQTKLIVTKSFRPGKGCSISVIFGLDPKIYFITIQEIAASSAAMTSCRMRQ